MNAPDLRGQLQNVCICKNAECNYHSLIYFLQFPFVIVGENEDGIFRTKMYPKYQRESAGEITTLKTRRSKPLLKPDDSHNTSIPLLKPDDRSDSVTVPKHHFYNLEMVVTSGARLALRHIKTPFTCPLAFALQ